MQRNTPLSDPSSLEKIGFGVISMRYIHLDRMNTETNRAVNWQEIEEEELLCINTLAVSLDNVQLV